MQRSLFRLRACQRTSGLRAQGWTTYKVLLGKLRKLGLQGKLWVYVGVGFIEVCCPNHDAKNFDAGRKFRIKDKDALLAYDTELRLGMGA